MLDGAVRAVSHEPKWDGMLAECAPWSPKDGELLVVAAHPDDEVRGAGGLIRAWATGGGRVRVLSVSDGEAADPRCRALANARREELNEALRKLCPTHIAVTRLGLPVGKIGEYRNRVRNALLSMASGEVTLVAPHEGAGHPDHEAVGSVCVEFARARGIPLARYGIEQSRLEASRPTAPSGAPHWVKFVLSDEARRAKARAVQCFRPPSENRRPVPSQAWRPPDRPYEAFLL